MWLWKSSLRFVDFFVTVSNHVWLVVAVVVFHGGQATVLVASNTKVVYCWRWTRL